MKKNLTFILSLAILSLTNPGRSAILYWDGGTGNITTNGDGISQGGDGTWDTTIQNWDQGDALPHIAWDNAQNYDAYFAGQPATVTLGAPITVNSLTFDGTNNYVVSDAGNPANTLTLNASTNISTTTIGANVVNPTIFSTYGGGLLILTNTSPSLTGSLSVNGGMLQIGNGAASSPGPIGFGDVTVGDSATFKISVGSASTYGQSISGTGSLYVQANSYSTAVTLAGANTFSGNVTVNQGNLTVLSISDTAANGLGLGTNVTIGASASSSYLTYAGYGDTTTRTITLSGAASATKLINANGFAPLVLLGPLAFGNTNKHTLTLSGTSTYLNTFGGTIADNTSTNTAVAKSGAGVWMLTGTNTYSGGTFLSGGGGSLLITNDYGLGAATGALSFTGAVTLKSASNNVTLGAARTVTVNSGITASFSVYDAKSFYIPSFITGAGGVSKGSASTSLGWVRFSNDTNNYTGDFGMGYGNVEFTSVADQGTPSALGQGATATGGRITIGNSTSVGVLRYVGAGNSATHRPLYWTATTGGLSLDNTNTGTIAYLSTTQLVNAAGSKALTLTGSNTGTNTLAHLINDSGGVTSLTKSGAGKWILSGANTYSGVTTISGGTLSVSSDANLGTVPASPANTVVLNGGTLSASASFTLNANRGIALGTTGTLDAAGGQTLTYGGIVANNTGTTNGSLVKTGAGTLVLSGANTYSGNTRINSGTLALSGSGSIVSSPNLAIAGGAALDVSGVSGGYALAPGQSLLATNGTLATVNGGLDLSSASLAMTNVPNTPTLTVTGGALTLAAGSPVTVNVNNSGNGLTAGSYKLIAKGSGGSVAGTVPTGVTVGGDGLATDAAAALSISAGELYLVVTGGTLYPPVVESFGLGGGGVVLSFSGTNGQTWKVLTSTNLTKPLANWDIATNGTFAGATVCYTNTAPVDPQRYYRITSP
jgi:autotransporter-associated beta strand protein